MFWMGAIKWYASIGYTNKIQCDSDNHRHSHLQPMRVLDNKLPLLLDLQYIFHAKQSYLSESTDA